MLLEAGYMGNTGHKQIGNVWINQPTPPTNPLNPTPFTARQPYPAVSPSFQQVTNYQWSNYNAGYVKLEQRLNHGLSYIVSYTQSRCIDITGPGQNMYNRQLERGLCDSDVPNNFTGSYVFDLPFGHGRTVDIRNPILNGVLGGWELSGISSFISGFPLTITTTGDIANVGTGTQRGNATGVRPEKLDPRNNGLLGLNRAAYSVPAAGTFGNLSRNTQRGFGINNWDMGINKNFGIRPLGEAGRLQIRAEFFNIFNHTQFNGISVAVNQPATFGIVTSALPPRVLQLAGKLYW